MHAILTTFIFILGASIGSFLSVVIYRISKKTQGIIAGRSSCPHCKKTLRSLDLIPILSYIKLRGKCRFCKKKISSRYLTLELLTAFAFITIFFRFPFFSENPDIHYGFSLDLELMLKFWLHLVYSTFLIGIFFYDLHYSAIPDLLLFPLIAITLIGSFIIGQPDSMSMIIAIGIAVLFFGGQILLSKGKWLGEGDLYLALGLALMFGWKMLLVAIMLSYILGALVSIVLLVTKKAQGKSKIPFGPFLVLGSFITIFFGEEILAWYLSSLII